jgi:para-aminobenzoate synthetase/4-amino-4-deoxychorismate lyase
VTPVYRPIPESIYEKLKIPNSLLLQTNKFDRENSESLFFTDPKEILIQKRGDCLSDFIYKAEKYLNRGYYLAGYFSYEARKSDCATNFPLSWLGVYEEPWRYSHLAEKTGGMDYSTHTFERPFDSGPKFLFAGKESKSTYLKAVESVLEHIRRGDTYQINLCGKFELSTTLSSESLFRILSSAFPVSYSAHLLIDEGAILSFSPELFFSRNQGDITARPMKGTAPRGRNEIEDKLEIEKLLLSQKAQAENVMIVDLIRNDLSQIALPGTVQVESLFNVEKFMNVFQLTSTVKSKLRDDISYSEIFSALFPSGSITGAPKISSMEIIRKTERLPRGVYTGAIGYISPNKKATFSVAIRTLEFSNSKVQMGVGGGVVWDSKPEEEYEECLLKGSFLTSLTPEFEIFETILWKQSFQNIDLHLGRLESSAKYFDFVFDRNLASTMLSKFADQSLRSDDIKKVKLSLNRFGSVKLTESAVKAWNSAEIDICKDAVSSQDRFLFHKTTNRKLYDRATIEASIAGLADYIFINEKGEITEGAISNIFVKIGTQYFTPPLTCGLLGGIKRLELISQLPNCSELVVTLDMLKSATQILICNSIRGVLEVSLRAS